MFILLFSLFISAAAFSADRKVEHKSSIEIEASERAGVRYHKRGDYKKAFELLGESAQWGMKQPQYLLGIMYLKGQYVDQSILTGMAWLGVATEIDIKEWRSTYDQIYSKLNVKQKAHIDDRVAIYIEMYGMKTQHLACSRRSSLESAKNKIHCERRADKISPLYELDSVPEN